MNTEQAYLSITAKLGDSDHVRGVLEDMTAHYLQEGEKQYLWKIELKKTFLNLFEIAGFSDIDFTNIPNEYCSRPHCCPDWFSVKTEFGVIKIGWRKRVINIDWSETEKDLETFFQDEVTKGKYFIHAWEYAKALQYLTTLRKYLSYSDDVLEEHRNYMGKESND